MAKISENRTTVKFFGTTVTIVVDPLEKNSVDLIPAKYAEEVSYLYEAISIFMNSVTGIEMDERLMDAKENLRHTTSRISAKYGRS